MERRGFARVQDGHREVFHFEVKSVAQGGNAAHTLHGIEHEAFGGQQGTRIAFHFEGFFAYADVASVFQQQVEAGARIDMVKNASRHFHACQYARLLDQKVCSTPAVFRDTSHGSVVAFANILG